MDGLVGTVRGHGRSTSRGFDDEAWVGNVLNTKLIDSCRVVNGYRRAKVMEPGRTKSRFS